MFNLVDRAFGTGLYFFQARNFYNNLAQLKEGEKLGFSAKTGECFNTGFSGWKYADLMQAAYRVYLQQTGCVADKESTVSTLKSRRIQTILFSEALAQASSLSEQQADALISQRDLLMRAIIRAHNEGLKNLIGSYAGDESIQRALRSEQEALEAFETTESSSFSSDEILFACASFIFHENAFYQTFAELQPGQKLVHDSSTGDVFVSPVHDLGGGISLQGVERRLYQYAGYEASSRETMDILRGRKAQLEYILEKVQERLSRADASPETVRLLNVQLEKLSGTLSKLNSIGLPSLRQTYGEGIDVPNFEEIQERVEAISSGRFDEEVPPPLPPRDPAPPPLPPRNPEPQAPPPLPPRPIVSPVQVVENGVLSDIRNFRRSALRSVDVTPNAVNSVFDPKHPMLQRKAGAANGYVQSAPEEVDPEWDASPPSSPRYVPSTQQGDSLVVDLPPVTRKESPLGDLIRAFGGSRATHVEDSDAQRENAELSRSDEKEEETPPPISQQKAFRKPLPTGLSFEDAIRQAVPPGSGSIDDGPWED